MPRSATPAHPPSNFASDNHALYFGWILGLMVKSGLPVQPVVDDDGNYTNRVLLDLAGGLPQVQLLIPVPPDGWKFDPLA